MVSAGSRERTVILSPDAFKFTEKSKNIKNLVQEKKKMYNNFKLVLLLIEHENARGRRVNHVRFFIQK